MRTHLLEHATGASRRAPSAPIPNQLPPAGPESRCGFSAFQSDGSRPDRTEAISALNVFDRTGFAT